jgi:nanoRNase/pAp phosphatase (c-di-AMP/oligoRNAs hydrolase)
VAVDAMSADQLSAYGEICAWTLAHSHARSGNAITLASYLGGGGHVGDAMARFASAYADQNEADHAQFSAWVTAGSPRPSA